MSSNRLLPSTPSPDSTPAVAPDPRGALVRLLGQLLAERAVDATTEEVDRAVRAAERALPTSGAAEPWRWLDASAARVGLRVTTVDRDGDGLLELLDTGPLVARSAQGWLVITRTPGDDLEVLRADVAQDEPLSRAALLAELSAAAPGERVRVAIVQRLTPAAPQVAPAHTTPFQRLLHLIRPDRRDVKTIVVFSVVVGLLNLATPVAVEALVNTVAFVGLLQPIVVLALVLAACLGLAAAIRALEAVVVEMIQRRVFVRVAADLAYRLPRVRSDVLDRVHGPELVNRFFDVTTVQKVGSKLLLDGVTAVLSAAIGLLVLAFYHPLLLGFDVLLLGALAFIVFVMGRGAVKTAIKESSSKYAVADWLEELLRHPLAFHLAHGRELATAHADTLANDYLQRRGAHYRIVLRQLIGALALQVFTSTLLLGLGGWLVKIGELTLGQLVASWLIVSLVLSAVAKLGRQLEGVYDLLAAADKLGVLFDLPLESERGEEPWTGGEGPARLELIGVQHLWPGGTPAFTPQSFVLEPGSSLAVVGPSGSGKSTLLELIQGQRPAQTGSIRFNGVDVRSLCLASLRPIIGLARPGEVIATTIAENVRLGRQLSLDEVRAALETVGLWEPTQQLPDGLDTELASFGRPLSDGQSDLLVLARALASRPRLLLIDGLLDGLADADLDRVFAALARPQAGWSLIVATRRDEVARRCAARHRLTPTPEEQA